MMPTKDLHFRHHPTESAPQQPASSKDDIEEGAKIPEGTIPSTGGFLLSTTLKLLNIGAWYWTNGMNGIAMQSFASEFIADTTTSTSTPKERFLETWSIATTMTAGQLLLGAFLGRVLLYGIDKTIQWNDIKESHEARLSVLHAFGSLATNIGFMYGKASLIQVIKLLEPFETLVLSYILFREGVFSAGVLSSLIVVVCAAMSLLNLQSTPPPPTAILFAVLSGISLSCRNVLQRKNHHHQAQNSSHSQRHQSKFIKSIIQFTLLSFYGGILMSGLAFLSVSAVDPSIVIPRSTGVLLWHPLYTILSMITLGFCLALTHSLLNAGKRVAAICMAIVWFSETFNAHVMVRLFLVGVGGCWYSFESKQTKQPDSGRRPSAAIFKLVLAGLVVLALLFAHSG